MNPRVRRYLRELLAIFGFVAVAAVVSVYILDHQRLRWPWEDVTSIEAVFTSAQAVTPGQGQTVNVAGVRVGEIGEVRLEEGLAVVRLDLDNDDLGPVYRNATVLLRPKTGLNDMSVQLDPGTPDPSLPDDGRLREGDRLGVANSLPNVNADEVIRALDADVRDYLAALVTAGGDGLEDRGDDLRRVLAATRPTLEMTERVTSSLTDRRRRLRRLVSNLRRLTRATASRDTELASLVSSASAALDAIGRREAELSSAVERLPGALDAGRDALAGGRRLAAELVPASRELLPVARAFEPALEEGEPLLREAVSTVRADVRPFVREAVPLLRRLERPIRRLPPVAPDLVPVGETALRTVNELLHNPEGPEEGYLFWTAWFAHNSASVVSTGDAHGAVLRGLAMVGCSTFGQVLAANPALQPLADAAVCPGPPPAPKASREGGG